MEQKDIKVNTVFDSKTAGPVVDFDWQTAEVQKIKDYCDSTRINGYEMPIQEVFDRKVEIAVKLWPQKTNDGEIRYLFGKGVGVELALRGEVQGRQKKGNDFPYRSHSDFEIYNYNGDYASDESAKNFHFVFGAQERYSKNETKALKNIPDGYMDSTYETVIYNGQEYLTPELEILFLDKYLRQESTPREEGCDAILLAREYSLDSEKVIKYYDDFVAKQAIKEIDDRINNDGAEIAVGVVKKEILNIESILKEDGIVITPERVTELLLRQAAQLKKIEGTSFKYIPSDIILVQTDNSELNIDGESKEKIRNLFLQDQENQKNKIDEKRVEIRNVLENIALNR